MLQREGQGLAVKGERGVLSVCAGDLAPQDRMDVLLLPAMGFPCIVPQTPDSPSLIRMHATLHIHLQAHEAFLDGTKQQFSPETTVQYLLL